MQTVDSLDTAALVTSEEDSTLVSGGSEASSASRRCASSSRLFVGAAVATVGVFCVLAIVPFKVPASRLVAHGADVKSVEQKMSLSEAIAAKMAESAKKAPVAKGVHDELFSVGAGFCTDHDGTPAAGLDSEDGEFWMASDVAADGSSEECANKCLNDPDCNGYATYGSSKCGLVKIGYPSWADGKGIGHCFYRHRFVLNTTDLYSATPKPVPKIIWAYWQNQAPPGSDKVPEGYPPLIEVCIASWKQLNPDWDIRVLNESTRGKWLLASDLPGDYDKQNVQHQSDAVRIAALEKYGGVWIDATIFMLKPLADILPDDPAVHTVMNLQSYGSQDDLHDRRVNWTNYVENWFMAAPPNDTVIKRTRECVMKLQPKLEVWQPLGLTGLFTAQQLELLFSLKINTYLSMHACFMKTVDEDAAIWHWWNGPQVQHLYAGRAGLKLFDLLGMDSAAIKKKVFDAFDKDVYEAMQNDDVKMIKIGGNLRHDMGDIKREQLWCADSTFARFLKDLGMKDTKLCGK